MKKAFSFLEVILATALVSVLMIAGSASVYMMYQAARNFHATTQSELNWYDFNKQITRDVHRSSFAEITNGGNTLTLRGYGNPPATPIIATYNNVIAGAITGMQYSTGGAAAQPLQRESRFIGVNATFVPVRLTNGQIREVRINVARPFSNVLYLRCGISLRPDALNTWARAIEGTGSRS